MRLVVFFSLLCMFAPNLIAETKILSRFGVAFYLPDNWRLLTLDELNAVDDADNSSKDLAEVNLKGREQLSKTMRTGGLELIFNTKKVKNTKGFYDNITLIETQDLVPEAAAQIKSTCSALPTLLSQTLGREVILDVCEGRNVQNYPAFVLSYAGDLANTRVVQYMLQLEQNRSLVFTLTYHNENLATVEDFESALQGLVFN
ncbi:hypothetical protein [Marinospirillum insulare]|uniref:DUF1795 domain-containing protein n=1 Tax=Marinospirillum insulare TaxID=217169 RepID=A0ABQ5ZYE4_9GAMM|nr:hypothetical protein [Marinospirillum insulare]GLR63367.1 hypothetical protein GCM10007878_08020 [Marinospirillum insulare]